LIRRVKFEGNEAFSDAELAMHVVSTPTDRSRRLLANKKLVIGSVTALGILYGLSHETARTENTLLWGGSGAFVGYGISRTSGVARCLHPGTLSGDILNLGGFYRDEGFKDVRVDTTTVIDGHWVDVTYFQLLLPPKS
jgi:hypothetical protein